MDSIQKLQELSQRIDHLENAGEWLARTLVNVDSAASQTGTLVTVLAEDIRERVLELVTELEKIIAITARETSHH